MGQGFSGDFIMCLDKFRFTFCNEKNCCLHEPGAVAEKKTILINQKKN